MEKFILLANQQKLTDKILWLNNLQNVELAQSIECYHLNTIKHGKDTFYCLVSATGEQYVVVGLNRACVICPKLANEITVLYNNQELVIPCPLVTTTVISLPLK
jgi:hypothetical protein